MKRKRKKQARVSDRPPEWANMLEALEAAVEQEPDNPEVVRALLQCYATGGDVEGALGLSERLIKLAPEDSYGYMVLAEIQLGLNYPGLTRHTLTRIPRPDSECTRRLRDVEAYLVGHRRYRGQPEPVELAKQFDTFLWQFRIAPEEVAADTARDLAARWPGAVYAHCDIAHTLWGRQEEVAVTLLLRLFQDHPTHPAVLSTLADAHTTAGRRAEAQALAKTLKDLGPLDLEDEVARAVTLSRLGDDQGVLDAFDAVPPPRVPALLHFAAAAACRLGRREHARRWWEEVLRQDCSEVPAAENLDDLKRAPAEREGPFAFRLSELWGQKRYERLVSVLDGPPWETEAQVREFIVAHPELPLLVTDALHRGDTTGRRIGLSMAEMLKLDDVLRRFALGQDGPLATRLKAAHACGLSGTVSMWNGEAFVPTTVIPPDQSGSLPPGRTELAAVTQGVDLMRRGRFKEAEAALLGAVSTDVSRIDVWFHIIVCILHRGNDDGFALHLLDAIISEHPDPGVAGIGRAYAMFLERKPGSARTLIEELERTTLPDHLWNILCELQIRMSWADHNLAKAQTHLARLEQKAADHPAAVYWKHRLNSRVN